MAKMTKTEIELYKDTLRIMLRNAHAGHEGSTVDPTRDDPCRIKVIVSKVSRDGMHRRLRVFVPIPDNGGWRVAEVSHRVAAALGRTYTDDGVGAPGCGMDMCFGLAYDLGSVLFGEGYSVKND